MRICGTGHRPNKLLTHFPWGVFLDDELRLFAIQQLERREPDEVISGMALGWDTALADAALTVGIPLIAAVPFKGQDEKWPHEQRSRYNSILDRAHQVKIVCRHRFSIAYQTRNEWMVDRSNRILALWNGSAGGTRNCITYANDWVTPIDNVWDEWISWVNIL